MISTTVYTKSASSALPTLPLATLPDLVANETIVVSSPQMMHVFKRLPDSYPCKTIRSNHVIKVQFHQTWISHLDKCLALAWFGLICGLKIMNQQSRMIADLTWICACKLIPQWPACQLFAGGPWSRPVHRRSYNLCHFPSWFFTMWISEYPTTTYYWYFHRWKEALGESPSVKKVNKESIISDKPQIQ